MPDSLKILRLEPRISRVLIVAATLSCLIVTWFSVRWHFANAVAPTYDRTRPESPLVADWLTGVAPSDPTVHYSAAVTFERTFNIADLDRSLMEYALATASSPNNYLMWLSLGKARNLNGDTAGAEAAFKRALELAPNYAVVQWAYGNFLVRQEKRDEGFAMIARAAVSSPEYARSAAVTALEIFDGDIQATMRALGPGDATSAALLSALMREGRFDEAVGAWERISDEGKKGKYLADGQKFVGDLIAAKKFTLAARVSSFISPLLDAAPAGTISNGGFESGVKLRDAGPFEWQIAAGGSPQIGLSEDRPHAGKYDLVIVFNSFDTAAFRTISQTVVVVPGAQYELQGFYRSDVKTASSLRWEVANAATTETIARTEELGNAAAWTPFSIRFAAPEGVDGVIVRFSRDGCVGSSCPTNGTISFDDLSVRRL